MSAMTKVKLEVIGATTTWTIWRYQNSQVFEGDTTRIHKNSILNSIILHSSSWFNNRASNFDFNWNDWMVCPL